MRTSPIIDHAIQTGADYLLFMDGDIEVVPFSTFAMLRYMETHGSLLGSIGANSVWQTPDRERATPVLFALSGLPIETVDLVAWTQYGMFRREVFEAGVKFDERGPFGGPGWGFEDNDLAFQMHVRGFLNQRFSGMFYLHRAARSSVRNLQSTGFDPARLYALRQAYMVDKWAHAPEIAAPLELVKRIRW